MRRREFVVGLGAGAAAWPVAVFSQQVTPLIGVLSIGSAPRSRVLLRMLPQGLRELGYVDGENVELQYRWADGKHDQLPALAADLVAQAPSVIIAIGSPSAQAAKAATTSLPVVFYLGPR